jgi:hypothetical protein
VSKFNVGDWVCVEPENIDDIWTPFLKYVGRKGYIINVYERTNEEVRYLLDFCHISWHERNLQPADDMSVTEDDVLELLK